MKFDEIISELQNKIYRPVYFLMGDESFFIDEITDYISANILTEVEKEFNQTIAYGRDVDVATIVSYAKRFPMMSNYQMVIIKEAQNVKNLIPDSSDKDKHLLEAYIENPLKSTILVLCYKYKTIDRRKSFTKLIEKNGVLFNSEKLYDNQLPAWIQNHLKKRNYSIRPEAAILLSEYLGSDLSKISNELSKLAINVPEGTEITPIHIEQNIGISKDFNVFELQKALGKKDIYKSFQIVNHFASNLKENPNFKSIPILCTFFSKILLYHTTSDKTKNNLCSVLSVNPYFFSDYQIAAKNYSLGKTKNIISLLRKYDMKSKGVDNASIPDGELLKELIYQILH
ncbi:MAG: DNA polymerase III subunit delta [Bacteroidetes bacterium]|nr:DNA polymerase III subunit delta [Bacteroidota bacterium]